ERIAKFSMIKNLISANGVFGPGLTAPAPYVIKEIAGPRIQGKKKKIRLGFVGLAQPFVMAESSRDAFVTDMYAAARRFVPQLRSQCDILIIVAHADTESSIRLAKENPEADIVISGNADSIEKSIQVGKTLIVNAAPGDTEQGDLRL